MDIDTCLMTFKQSYENGFEKLVYNKSRFECYKKASHIKPLRLDMVDLFLLPFEAVHLVF